ncbi:MAG: hypothetical protein PF569_05955 [Candidatus Woesearchaeota archaeon]|jgi:hypothetical protein|nr:hypothetical protein [Candidatus Woesearchaeota archaeon]
MVDLNEYIYSNHLLSKEVVTLVYNFENINYQNFLESFKSNSPFSGKNEHYSFESLNCVFFRKGRIENMSENRSQFSKLNVFLYDFDIFNHSAPNRAIKTLDMIVQKYDDENGDYNLNKVLIFAKSNAKLFCKDKQEESNKLLNLMGRMNIIDLLRI